MDLPQTKEEDLRESVWKTLRQVWKQGQRIKLLENYLIPEDPPPHNL